MEKKRKNEETPMYAEGSIEVVSMNDESHFVTGSDNGNVSLWSLAKKKPLSTHRIADVQIGGKRGGSWMRGGF